MRFNADAKELTKAIKDAALALPRRPVIAETGMVKIEATFDGTYITGTDTTFYIQSSLNADVEVQGNLLVVPKDITVTTEYADDGEIATVDHDGRQTKLHCRGESKVKWMTDDNVIDFDAITKGEEVTIPLTDRDLVALGVTCDATSVLPLYSCLQITADDGTMRFLTVGGANSWFTYITKPSTATLKACLPYKYLVQSFKATLDTREITVAHNCIIEDARVCTVFPQTNYEPKDFKKWLDVMSVVTSVRPNYPLFVEALTRGMHYTGPEGALCISGSGDELFVETINGNESKIPVPVVFNGPGIDIAFNGSVMLNSLKSIGDGAEIMFYAVEGKEHNIINVTDEEISHILMPVSIRRSY